MMVEGIVTVIRYRSLAVVEEGEGSLYHVDPRSMTRVRVGLTEGFYLGSTAAEMRVPAEEKRAMP